MNPAAQAVGSILRFDKKVNSYKLALVRALNDVVLSYPDLPGTGLDVMQGPRAMRGGVLGNDVSFRPALTSLRSAWKEHFGTARPPDGFLLVAELRVPRIAASYPPRLQRAYRVALTAVAKALAQPIRYAGPGGETHGVFPPPAFRDRLAWGSCGARHVPRRTQPTRPSRPVVGIPRALAVDRGLVPSDEYFNAHTKRARMPTARRMASATLHLAQTYGLYMGSQILGHALDSDLRERFALSQIGEPEDIAEAVAGATLAIADARSVARF